MTLVKYIRNRKGQPFGAVVAVDPTHVGWSLCHVSPVSILVEGLNDDGVPTEVEALTKGDVFNKKKAVKIAESRAIHGYSEDSVPSSVRKDLEEMRHRAKRYFKGVAI